LNALLVDGEDDIEDKSGALGIEYNSLSYEEYPLAESESSCPGLI